MPSNPAILYSCYHTLNRSGEQFVPEHILSFQLAGSLKIEDGRQSYVFEAGSIRFHQRNHLLKFWKQLPPDGGEFKSLSIYFDQQMLLDFSREYGHASAASPHQQAIVRLEPSRLYNSFLQSLQPYEQIAGSAHKDLLQLKLKEALLILLKSNPELAGMLFDFTPPGKIDLEAFMFKNYLFNVSLGRFAYLTGRSLATFKRDFEKLFHTSPGRWLLEQRLKEAHYRIKEEGRRPSDVYLELGFEDLSHFSFAFKKAYGIAPSLLT
jgi:AraC-like DNA-binding protein